MYAYNNYVLELHNKFKRRLDDMAADYNFDSGNEFEIAVCEVLRDFLPLKYGICRGHVVSFDGSKEGDDIIVFDQERFPTLRLNKREDYARKQNIPIEAVYAYFEAKHSLNEESLERAISQLIKVRKLINSREGMPVFMTDPYELPKVAMAMDGFPSIRNASFTGIISKYINLKPENNSNGGKDYLKEILFKRNVVDAEFLPEFVMAGPSLTADIGMYIGGKYKAIYFNMPNIERSYDVRRVDDFGFGMFLIRLFATIDWIRLNKMPWIKMLNEV